MDYKGFYLDNETSDHSVTVIHQKLGINSVWGNVGLAKAYVDGILEGIKQSKK